MKRVVLIGMMVVFVAVASLPAIGVYANFPGITGNNPTSEIQTSSHTQYHKKQKKQQKKKQQKKKGKKGKRGCKGKRVLAKAGPAKAGRGCAAVGGVKAGPGGASVGGLRAPR